MDGGGSGIGGVGVVVEDESMGGGTKNRQAFLFVFLSSFISPYFSLQHAGSVLNYHGGSFLPALFDLYPNIGLDRRKFSPANRVCMHRREGNWRESLGFSDSGMG